MAWAWVGMGLYNDRWWVIVGGWSVILMSMPPVLEIEELKPAGPNGGGPHDLGPDDRGGGGGGGDEHQKGRLSPGAGLVGVRFAPRFTTVLFFAVCIWFFFPAPPPFNW